MGTPWANVVSKKLIIAHLEYAAMWSMWVSHLCLFLQLFDQLFVQAVWTLWTKWIKFMHYFKCFISCLIGIYASISLLVYNHELVKAIATTLHIRLFMTSFWCFLWNPLMPFKWPCTVVSYQNDSFSSKWDLPSGSLLPSKLEGGLGQARQLSFWWNTHFDRRLQYTYALSDCCPWNFS